MIIKVRYLALTATVFILLSVSLLQAQFSGGSGTADEPFLIATVEDLNEIRDYPASFFRQIDNISLDVPPWNEGEGWEPIGTSDDPFTGYYYGNGHRITNLYSQRFEQRSVGLFGTAYEAHFYDIILESVNILGFSNVGGLIGHAEESRIQNCKVTGSVEGVNYYTGGLIGWAVYSIIVNCESAGFMRGYGDVGGLIGANNESTLSYSNSSAELEGNFGIGGLVGYNVTGACCGRRSPGGLAGSRETAIIEHSFATGFVNGNQNVGGLVGTNKDAVVSNSYATGDVSGDSNLGGLVGTNSNSEIINSFASGSAVGQHFIGGLVGFSISENQFQKRRSESRFDNKGITRSRSLITDSYSIGSADGEESIGGLVGYNENADITNSYSLGTVAGEMYVGGLVGRYISGNVDYSYWNIETSQMDHSDVGEGRHSDEMRPPYHDTFFEWDFEEIWSDDLQNQNDGFPILAWQLIELDPNPVTASEPFPYDEEKDVSVELDSLAWSFYHSPDHSEPVGFRVYINNSDEFEQDDYYWVGYELDRSVYALTIEDDIPLAYETTYYWMVVPTTVYPNDEERSGFYKHRSQHQYNMSPRTILSRGDAENPEIWSFTTVKEDETYVTPLDSNYVTALKSNYPNPFNPVTSIRFSLAQESIVEIDIFNVKGQRVAVLWNGNLPAGEHSVQWNGTSHNLKEQSSGIYYYRMISGDYQAVDKMILIK